MEIVYHGITGHEGIHTQKKAGRQALNDIAAYLGVDLADLEAALMDAIGGKR